MNETDLKDRVVKAMREAARELTLGRLSNVLEAILLAANSEDELLESVLQITYAEALASGHVPDPKSEDPLHDWSDNVSASQAASLLRRAARRLEGRTLLQQLRDAIERGDLEESTRLSAMMEEEASET